MRKLFSKMPWGRILPALWFAAFLTTMFVASPTAKLAAQTWVSGFLRDSNGFLYVNCANCNAGNGVQSVTAGDTTVNMGGTASNPTVAVNLANNSTYSGNNIFNGTSAFNGAVTHTALDNIVGAGGANACAGTNFPATVYGLCLGANNGATNLYAAIIGPAQSTFACTAACTAGDSERFRWNYSTTTGVGTCDEFLVATSKSWEATCSGVIAGNFRTEMLYNNNSNNWSGVCASITSAHCVTGTIGSFGGLTESTLNCFELDTTNHAFAVDSSATLTAGSAYTFTATIPNGFVGSTSTAPTNTDAGVWWCWHP